MPTWDSRQYLRFARERTQPALDLAARVELAAPARIIDLGCGPGNSTAVLAQRWPQAQFEGLDSSEEMLTQARQDFPHIRWVKGAIEAWQPAQPYDLLYANAALQWVPDHATLLPRLLRHVADGGVFAFQVPANLDAPAHRLMRELGNSAAWKSKFTASPREWRVENPEFYYDVLAPYTTRLDLWTTDYLHILPDAAAVIEWYRGTGLRPWLDALATAEEKNQFLQAYTAEIAEAYPPRSDGRVLFPFRRLFVVAYR